MELTLKVVGTLISLLGVAAAIYNMAKSHRLYRQGKHDEKLDQAHAMGLRNQQSIENLEQRMNERDARTEKRLDQIGADVSDVKKLFTEYIIDNLKSLIKPH